MRSIVFSEEQIVIIRKPVIGIITVFVRALRQLFLLFLDFDQDFLFKLRGEAKMFELEGKANGEYMGTYLLLPRHVQILHNILIFGFKYTL